jgi:hypothetical protein
MKQRRRRADNDRHGDDILTVLPQICFVGEVRVELSTAARAARQTAGRSSLQPFEASAD